MSGGIESPCGCPSSVGGTVEGDGAGVWVRTGGAPGAGDVTCASGSGSGLPGSLCALTSPAVLGVRITRSTLLASESEPTMMKL